MRVNRVDRLNADRGRVLGPARTQEVQKGPKVKLFIHGKYEVAHQDRLEAGIYQHGDRGQT
ncbi:hypothetical protein [Cyclobacterium sp. SYSU L10401]|uniref:hypothetical protein n=1 Tax=Cyclobacterium sp. SYSU L10401 TaxID=2678657 RepID=UPI0013D27752|nr:hypothetical protein [Cyclobacterium sp. SYSU L10401]